MDNASAETRPEPTPELIAEITRRARIERSRALWQLLQGMFGSHAADDEPARLPHHLRPRSS
ncbi:MAG: hypothetical protein ACM31O_17515 [Bacteroidota bacterium]|jgi:hypothetical protein